MLTLPYQIALMITMNNTHPVTAWRNYYGMTQKILADSIGISEYEVQEIEQSNKHLKQENMAKLAHVFGIQEESLNIRYYR